MKFEYRIQPLLYRAAELEKKLNDAGSQGWEAVGAIECGGKYQVLLKRGVWGDEDATAFHQVCAAAVVRAQELAEKQHGPTSVVDAKPATRVLAGWTPERRKAASKRAKKRWAEKAVAE